MRADIVLGKGMRVLCFDVEAAEGDCHIRLSLSIWELKTQLHNDNTSSDKVKPIPARWVGVPGARAQNENPRVVRKWQTSRTWGKSPASIRPSWRKPRRRRTPCRSKRPLNRKRGVKSPKSLGRFPPPHPFISKTLSWCGGRATGKMDASHKLHCEPGHSVPMPPARGSLKEIPPPQLIGLPNFTGLPWDIIENYLYDWWK